MKFLNDPYSLFQKNETLKSWNKWLLSNWSRLLNWKGPGTYPQSSKLFQRFLNIIALACINQLAQFGDLMSFGSKNIFEHIFEHLVSCTHLDVTDLVNHEMVKNAKSLNNLKTEHNFSAKWNNSQPVPQITHFEKLSFYSGGNL